MRDIIRVEKWEKKRPYIGQKHASYFVSSRPQISWELADYIYYLLEEQKIKEIGCTGSMCASVLIALAYGDAKRQVNGFTSKDMWHEIGGWNHMLEDSPGMEKNYPYAKFNIPFHQQINIWDGASPFFYSEAIFCDLPFSHRCVNLKLKHLTDKAYKIIILGFLQSYEGPDDVLNYFQNNSHYKMTKKIFKIDFIENNKNLNYELVAFELIK